MIYYILLMFAISITGFVLTLAMHLCSLFSIYDPPRTVMLVFSAGVIFTFVSYCWIMNKLKNNQTTKEYNRAMRNAAPQWLDSTVGFIILYGLIGLLLVGIGRYHSDTGIAGIYYHSFSSHWMAVYALMSSLFYSTWCLRKKRAINSEISIDNYSHESSETVDFVCPTHISIKSNFLKPLMLLAIAGFVYCIGMHLYMYFSPWYPSRVVPILINIGMGINFFYIANISRKWKKQTDKNLFHCLIQISPYWLKISTVIFFLLGACLFVYYLIESFSCAFDRGSVQQTSSYFFRSFSALLMVFYAIEYAILYSWRIFLKIYQDDEPGESFEWTE